MGRQWTISPAGADNALGSPNATGVFNSPAGYGPSAAANGARHLSDGTLVFLYYDATNGWVLAYTTNRLSVSTIATHLETALRVPIATALGSTVSLYGLALALGVDASDNIYVGASVAYTYPAAGGGSFYGAAVAALAFSKTSLLVWQQRAASMKDSGIANAQNPASDAIAVSVEWAPTTGGTNGGGHLVIGSSVQGDFTTALNLTTLDAGALLAGTSATSNQVTLTSTTGASIAAPLDLAPNALAGSFATSGLVLYGFATGVGGPGTYFAQSYSVGLQGFTTLGSSFIVGSSGGGPGGGGTTAGLCRLVNVGPSVWAALVENTARNPQIARLSSTAVLTSPTTYGAVSNFPSTVPNTSSGSNSIHETGHSLDIVYDSGANKVWLYAWHTSTNTTMLRLGAALSSGVGWDSVTTTEDTLVGNAGTNDMIRTVKAPVDLGHGDWLVADNIATNPTTVIGDYGQYTQPPLAPTITFPANGGYADLNAGFTATWVYNKGGGSGTQNAYSLRRKNAANASTVTTVQVASNVATITTLTAHNLNTNDVVTIAGLSTSVLNGTWLITAATSTTFQFAVVTGNTGPSADSGTATPAYGYWNGGSWSTTQVWVSSTSSSATFSGGVWLNGVTYNWSVATQEATLNQQGIFAFDSTVTGRAAPVVTVTGPSSPASQLPTVTWTVSFPAGASQISYRVLIYPLSITQVAGFAVGSSGASFDSGVVSSVATSAACTSLLVSGTQYVPYVQVTETGSELSAWASGSTFTATSAMATPTLTATFDAANNRVQLTVQGADNILTYNESSIETDASGWVSHAGTQVSQSPLGAVDGSFSLLLTPMAPNTTLAADTAVQAAVSPNTQYTALASFEVAPVASGTQGNSLVDDGITPFDAPPPGLKAPNLLRAALVRQQIAYGSGAAPALGPPTSRTCTVAIKWFQSSGAASSHPSDTSAGITDLTTGFTQASLTVTSPSDAALAIITVSVANASEQHLVDAISLAPGSSTTWARGGFIPNETATVQYSTVSSSGPWANVRNGAAVALSTSEAVTVYDYEEPVGTVYYQAYMTSTTSSGAATTSAVVAATAVVSMTDWWIKDPLNSATNAPFHVQTFDFSWKERSTGYKVIGSSTDLVVSDVVEAEAGTISVLTYTTTDFSNLTSIVTLQKVVLIQSPFGEQFYARLMADRKGKLSPSASTAPWRVTTLTWSGQPRP